MVQKLYKEIDYKAIKHSKFLIDEDTTLGKKCWEWAEKKALEDYIKGKWRFMLRQESKTKDFAHQALKAQAERIRQLERQVRSLGGNPNEK